MKAADVIQDAFTENLGTDWVIVDANGRVIGRTSDEHTARVIGHPAAAGYFTGQDFEKPKADGSAFDRDGDGHVGGSNPKEKPLTKETLEETVKEVTDKGIKAHVNPTKTEAPAAKKEEPKKAEAKKPAGKK